MQNTHPSSGPTRPWMLMPLVRLLQWSRRGLGALVGQSSVGRSGALDLVGAVILVGAITMTAVLGAPPVLTIGGGIGLAVLFVVARSWIVAHEHSVA